MFTLFNASAPSWNLFVLTLLEVTATAWLYGAERYANLFYFNLPRLRGKKLSLKVTVEVSFLRLWDRSDVIQVGLKKYTKPWEVLSYRLLSNLEEINGGQKINPVLRWYWKSCWTVVTPAILSVLLVMALSLGRVEYEGYVYPVSIQALGYLITACTLVWIPIFAVIESRNNSRYCQSYFPWLFLFFWSNDWVGLWLVAAARIQGKDCSGRPLSGAGR